MRFVAADCIYPGNSGSLYNKVVVLAEDGTILDIWDEVDFDKSKVERFNGFLCPGFINTHCHLELSHMKGKIEEGGGLHNFIKEVEKLKRPGDDEISDAIKKADEEMHRNGIVAVGDICNTASTFGFKIKSELYYHNFIEIYAFDETRAADAFQKGIAFQEELRQYLGEKLYKQSSITPHAPYSASKKLLSLFTEYARKHHSILTIHNQETADEDFFFKEKRGNILERLLYFKINTDNWQAPGISSLKYTLPQLPKENKLLLVHNTFTSEEDIQFANHYNPNLFWCFCPNANLYIEERLPAIQSFIDNTCAVTLGTDSYASNWSLSIWDEIKNVQKHFPKIMLEQILPWATINGAKFLGIETWAGSIEKGKKPGINLISKDLRSVEKIV